MINKDRLLTIEGLKLEGVLESMDDAQLDEYGKALEKFIDVYGRLETEAREAYKKNNKNALIGCLASIRVLLAPIHAEELAAESLAQIEGLTTVENIHTETIESFLEHFLTAASTLSIDLQLAEHHKEKEEDEETAEKPEEVEGEDRIKNILAVDDVALFISMIKTYLHNTRFNVTGVTSGKAALKYLENNTPDLFILDVEMPEMNGYELAEKIREKGCESPIIFLTGNSKKESVIRAVQAGGVDFIVKPGSKLQVFNKICKYI